MVILGLLLLLSATGLAIDVAVENPASIGVDAVGQRLSLSGGWLFVAGIATGMAGLVGMGLVSAGLVRSRRRRAALVASRTSLEGLRAERDQLAVALERERSGRPSTPAERRHHPAAVGDPEPAVIDLADERHSERLPGGDGGARRPSPEQRREPVASGRRGLFHRRP